MNLTNPRRNELQGIPFLNNALDHVLAAINQVFTVEHTADGHHSDITATSVTTTEGVSATGNIATEADLIALDGSGLECGLGQLSTVNGDPVLPAQVIRQGMLLGGASTGCFFEWRLAQSPFLSGHELAVWNLEQSTTRPLLRLGVMLGVPTIIDGGSGASLALGDLTEPLAGVTTNTLVLDGATAGVWTARTFSAGDFTASAGTWTVDAGDILTHRYMRIGDTLWLSFAIVGTDVSNAGVTLRITLPEGFTAAATTFSAIRAIDAGAAKVSSIAVAPVGQTYLELYATAAAGTFSNTGADNTTVSGMAVIEVA